MDVLQKKFPASQVLFKKNPAAIGGRKNILHHILKGKMLQFKKKILLVFCIKKNVARCGT